MVSGNILRTLQNIKTTLPHTPGAVFTHLESLATYPDTTPGTAPTPHELQQSETIFTPSAAYFYTAEILTPPGAVNQFLMLF